LTAEAALGGSAPRASSVSDTQSASGVVPQKCGFMDVIGCAGTMALCAVSFAVSPAAGIACVTKNAPGCLKCI
jgi:hypothetical protein